MKEKRNKKVAKKIKPININASSLKITRKKTQILFFLLIFINCEKKYTKFEKKTIP